MSVHTLGEAQALGLRLFLEGLEVPVISATVDINEGSAAVAQIEIVGLDSAMKFKPRTMVHLFFFDGGDYKYGPQTSKKTSGGERTDPSDPFSPMTPTKTETTALTVDDRYRLLFMGELFSYTYQKSGSGSRSVILNCIDFSNYWDTSFIFQVSGEEGLLDVPQIQPFITGSDLFVNNVVEENVALLIKQMSKENGGPQLTQSILPSSKVEFLSSLMGILEMLGGVSVIDDSKPPTKANPNYTRYSVHGGMTPWHTISERRVRLLDQLATDDGKTAANMFDQDAFEQFLKRQSDLTSSVLSFRDILNLLLGHVYYSTFPNPCGRLLKGEPVAPHTLPAGPTTPWVVPPYTIPTNRTLDPRFLAPGTDEQALNDSRVWFGGNPVGPIAVPKQLSAHFTFDQLTNSRSNPQLVPQNRLEAIKVYNYLQDLCLYILEPLREKFPRLSVNSGFRGPALNGATKGASKSSQHMLGQAADLDFGGAEENWRAFKYIAYETTDIPFGQLIFEKDSGRPWVHISLGTPWWRLDRDIRCSVPNPTTGGLSAVPAPKTWNAGTPLPKEYGGK